MAFIDLYTQYITKHHATSVDLGSDRTVRIRFPHGERTSSKTLRHERLEQLLLEVAPPEAIEALHSSGRTRFLHPAYEGFDIEVKVVQIALTELLVTLSPASTDGRVTSPHMETPTPPSSEEFRDSLPAVSVPGPASSGPADEHSYPPSDHSTPPSDYSTPPSDYSTPPNDYSEPRRDHSTPPRGRSMSATDHDVIAGQARASHRPPASVPSVGLVDLKPTEARINRYLHIMVKLGASDLHLTSGVPVLVRVQGEMKVIDSHQELADHELRSLLHEIMPEEKRTAFEDLKEIDFGYGIESVARFRCNVFTDRRGVGAVFRQIPVQVNTPRELGIPTRVVDLCWLAKGLVIVTGPAGCGKSTTLASLVNFINEKRRDHIITIEDPIEFIHENNKCLVHQREIGTHTNSIQSALRAAFREDPDVVVVGELKDPEIVSLAMELAETGHLVFGTLPTASTVSAVDRLIDQFPTEHQLQIRVMLAETLRAVVAQVLCKRQTGGQVAAFEVLLASPTVTQLLREGRTNQLPDELVASEAVGMQTMNEHLIQLIQDDVVAPEEGYIKAHDKGGLEQRFHAEGIAMGLIEEPEE